MGSSLMSLPLINDRRLGVGVKSPSYAALGGSSLPVAAHLISRLSCMMPSVVLSGAGSPLPFFPRGFGREASIFQSQRRAHATTSQTPQRQHRQQTSIRVLFVLPLKPPTSRIQDNKQTATEPIRCRTTASFDHMRRFSSLASAMALMSSSADGPTRPHVSTMKGKEGNL